MYVTADNTVETIILVYVLFTFLVGTRTFRIVSLKFTTVEHMSV
jgi:hypothetical protein